MKFLGVKNMLKVEKVMQRKPLVPLGLRFNMLGTGEEGLRAGDLEAGQGSPGTAGS